MTIARISVPGPITLVLARRISRDLDNQPMEFIREISVLAAGGTLPVTVETADKGGWRVAVHSSRHVGWLYATQAGDAYVLGHASRRGFRDEHRLTQQALLVACPAQFVPFDDLPTYNLAVRQGRAIRSSTYLDHLLAVWHGAAAQADQPPGPPADQVRYLEALEAR